MMSICPIAKTDRLYRGMNNGNLLILELMSVYSKSGEKTGAAVAK